MDRMNYADDPAYTRLISLNMKVPQRIKATGEFDDEPHHGPNGTASHGGWDYSNEKFDMNVPDRILLMGQDQHLGTKAPPREITLDNAVLPSDPGMIRVNTPPRVIRLDEHYFPAADEMGAPPSPPRARPRPQGDGARASTPRGEMPGVVSEQVGVVETRLALREQTPPFAHGEGLSTSEEVVHLRRQIAKLNRRVMAIELETIQRQQKEKIAYAFGIAYILFKVIAWLNRS